MPRPSRLTSTRPNITNKQLIARSRPAHDIHRERGFPLRLSKSMSDIVIVEHLVKRYGPRPAVRDVSFSIAQGEVVGLLGPNGSGKSTIMRMLTGYLPPSEGMIRVGDLDVQTDSLAVRQRIGYVPEDTPLYEGMRVHEFLRFMGHIRGMSGRRLATAVTA